MSQISQLAIPQPVQSSVQFIDNTAASDGQFQCLFDGEATTQLTWSISAGSLQTALEGLTTIGSGNVVVSGSQAAGYTLTFQGSAANQVVPRVLVCGCATSKTITSSVLQKGSHYDGFFDPSNHNPVIVNYPNFGMYSDNTFSTFVTSNGVEVKAWLDACGSGNYWEQTGTSTFAQLTITPASTATAGYYILASDAITPQLATGMLFNNGNLTKISGSTAWDAQWGSNESYTNPYLSFKASQTNAEIMVGISTSVAYGIPTYQQIEHAWFADGAGVAEIYESGSQVLANAGAYTTSTVFSIIYDGTNVLYYLDGVLKHSTTISMGGNFLVAASKQVGVAVNSLLYGNSFGPTATPTLSGWTLTSGSNYNAGAFTLTANTVGPKLYAFDDSFLVAAWDGTVDNSNFLDGTNPTAAVQVVQENPGTNDPPSGNWSLGDWTGDVSATPAPTGWSVSGGIGGFTATRTATGSGQSPLGWDTSALIGNDMNPWDGSLSQVSFTDGTDGVQATQYLQAGSAGTHAPNGGTWSISGSSSVAISTHPTDVPSWTIYGGSPGTSLYPDIYSNTAVIYLSNAVGSGYSALVPNLSAVTMSITGATPSFTDGIGYSPTYINGNLDFTSTTATFDGLSTISGFPIGAADRSMVFGLNLQDWNPGMGLWGYGTGSQMENFLLEHLGPGAGSPATNAGWSLDATQNAEAFPNPISPDTTNFHDFAVSTTNGDFAVTTRMYWDGAEQSYSLWENSAPGNHVMATVVSAAYVGVSGQSNYFCSTLQLYGLFLGSVNVGIIG